jgi:hypothetical protein
MTIVSGTQVRREIHDPGSRSVCALDPLQRCAMRQRAEDEVGFIEGCVFSRDEREGLLSDATTLPSLSVRGCKCELE